MEDQKKFCADCGSQINPKAEICPHCGVRQIQAAAAGSNAGMRMLLPVDRSGLAIAAGYAGFFALLVLPAPLALILGILAVLDIRKNSDKHGMGRALFGLITGALGTFILLGMFLQIF